VANGAVGKAAGWVSGWAAGRAAGWAEMGRLLIALGSDCWSGQGLRKKGENGWLYDHAVARNFPPAFRIARRTVVGLGWAGPQATAAGSIGVSRRTVTTYIKGLNCVCCLWGAAVRFL
jgi:hypothetical protein